MKMAGTVERSVDNGGETPLRSKNVLANPQSSLSSLIGRLFVLLASVLIVAEASSEIQPLLAAMAAIVLIAVWFLSVIQRRERGRLPFFEIGPVFVAVVLLYSLYPAIIYIQNGSRYFAWNEHRLFLMQPSNLEMAVVASCYALLLLSFSVTYLLTRGWLPEPDYKVKAPRAGGAIIQLLLCIIVMGNCVLVIMPIILGVPGAERYVDTYIIYRSLPPIVGQLVNFVSGAVNTSNIMLLIALISDYRRYWKYIYLLLAFQVLWCFIELHDRTTLITWLLAFMLVYHQFVSPPKLRTIATEGLVILMLFTVLGFVRDLAATPGASSSGVISNLSSSSGEFDAILANSLETIRLKAVGQSSKLSINQLYLSDLTNTIAPLPPFQRFDLTEWYVETYYPAYADVGGGFCMGIVGEAFLGNGFPDIVWRGALLGCLCGWLHRRYTLGRKTFWRLSCYVWFLVMSYWIVRGTAFYLLPVYVHHALIPIVIIQISIALLRPSGMPEKGLRGRSNGN